MKYVFFFIFLVFYIYCIDSKLEEKNAHNHMHNYKNHMDIILSVFCSKAFELYSVLLSNFRVPRLPCVEKFNLFQLYESDLRHRQGNTLHSKQRQTCIFTFPRQLLISVDAHI